MQQKNHRIGLALSGGGYRAAAFHLGTLNKLHEMKVLNKVDVLSTISGGSITGAAWCLHKGDYPGFHEEMLHALQTKNVIRFALRQREAILFILLAILFLLGPIVLSFTSLSWLSFPLLALFFILLFKYQFRLFPVSHLIEKAYDAFFFHGKTLKDLNPAPLIAIGSSNLHTGRPFTFSQRKMADTAYTSNRNLQPPVYFHHEEFPIARAVMASSCVPFAFSPVEIGKSFFRNSEDANRVRPVLVDGGVYDNQGIQKLTQPKSSYECGIIITSDAGGSFMANENYPNTLALLLRTVNLFMYRIKAVQMVQHIYRNVQGAAKPIAYFSLGWKVENLVEGFYENLKEGHVLPEVTAHHQIPQQWLQDPVAYKNEIIGHLKTSIGYADIEKRLLSEENWQLARSTGTNLTPLSRKRLDALISHAENLTEVQLKLYCPSILETNEPGTDAA